MVQKFISNGQQYVLKRRFGQTCINTLNLELLKIHYGNMNIQILSAENFIYYLTK